MYPLSSEICRRPREELRSCPLYRMPSWHFNCVCAVIPCIHDHQKKLIQFLIITRPAHERTMFYNRATPRISLTIQAPGWLELLRGRLQGESESWAKKCGCGSLACSFTLEPHVSAAFRRCLGAAGRRIASRLDAGADTREDKWLMRLGNAYKYASKFEDAAFFLDFGNICAACGGLLAFKA